MRTAFALLPLALVLASGTAAGHHADSSETGTHCTWTGGTGEWQLEGCFPCTVWIEAWGWWFWVENDHPSCRPK